MTARIHSIKIVGGFLDGLEVTLSERLNCVIGERGTGKSTLVELIRFALDRPIPGNAAERQRAECLVRKNLGGGRVQLQVETPEGVQYILRRSWGEAPTLWTLEDKPVPFQLTDLFRADVYSQNEVEAIADDDAAQLALIDRFAESRIAEVSRQIERTYQALDQNLHELLPLEQQLSQLPETNQDLALVERQLQDYDTADAGSPDDVKQGQRHQALRDREQQTFQQARDLLVESGQSLDRGLGRIGRNAALFLDQETATGPNAAMVAELSHCLQQASQQFDRGLQLARQAVSRAQAIADDIESRLRRTHQVQDGQFRKLLESHREALGRASQRAELSRQQNRLLAKKRVLADCQARLQALREDRTALLQQLSELCDQRYAIRSEVCSRINEVLNPTIRVEVVQNGNRDAFRQQLASVLKGAGVRNHVVAGKLAATVWPAKLVRWVRGRDVRNLAIHCEIGKDQAQKVISHLAQSTELDSLETTEMVDQVRIELQDGDVMKLTTTLSTGQKCTAILPILLLESQYPLLVDQPEDNLDNAFIFKTVNDAILPTKLKRQLVFVTHNANIPVLGDAERVVVLHSDGSRARKLAEGTVDACRNPIIDLLEGGETAFQMRRDRYESTTL